MEPSLMPYATERSGSSPARACGALVLDLWHVARYGPQSLIPLPKVPPHLCSYSCLAASLYYEPSSPARVSWIWHRF